jgi:hypothetical protein
MADIDTDPLGTFTPSWPGPEMTEAARAGQQLLVVDSESDRAAAEKLGLVTTLRPPDGASANYKALASTSVVLWLRKPDSPGEAKQATRDLLAFGLELERAGVKVGIWEGRGADTLTEHLRHHKPDVAGPFEQTRGELTMEGLAQRAGADGEVSFGPAADSSFNGNRMSVVGPASSEGREVRASKDTAAGLADRGLTGCRMKLTPASSIKVRPVRWLWEGRLPLGSLALVGGREGIGKSTASYQLAADVTRGRLRGAFYGVCKSVIVAATEDSWAHTIVPRLMAADADLDRVFRVEVETDEGEPELLCLPRDIVDVGKKAIEVDAVLVLLDPLLSRLSSKLDTHKDADVRRALEPLITMAETSQVVILGIIHVNKSGSVDALSLIMASVAFTAVARAVLFVIRDPDNDHVRLLGQPKNNLGRHDLPTLTFTIGEATVADTDEGPVKTGRLVWGQESDRDIRDVLTIAAESAKERSTTAEAAEWLRAYLLEHGGGDDHKSIAKAGDREGFSRHVLRRAGQKLKVEKREHGFPKQSFWSLPGFVVVDPPSGASSGANPGETFS